MTEQKTRPKGFWSIQTKLALTYLLIILIVAGISLGFIMLFTDGFVVGDTRKQLKEDAQILAQYHASTDIYAADALEVMYDRIVDNNFSIILFDKNKSYYGWRNLDRIIALYGDDFESKFIGGIVRNLDRDGSTILNAGSSRVMIYTQTVRSNTSGVVYGYVVLCSPLQDFGIGSAVFVLYLCAVMMASVLAMLIASVMAGKMSSDIKYLTRRAQQIAKRNFSAGKLQIDSHDEVEELARNIEDMSQSIQEYDLNQKLFLQNASHELRTPLMSIRGYVEGVKDGVFDDTGEACDLILGQVSRLEKLVNDVMYLSKIETSENLLNKQPVSLREIVDESVSRVAGIVASGPVHLEVSMAADVPLFADTDMLATAVTNVLSNCMRYAHSRVTLDTFLRNGWAVIRICDDGNGINEGDLPHMFDRFYKGKNGKHGLGLAIAKAAVEQHQGTIRAYNRSSGFTLPAPVEQPARKQGADRQKKKSAAVSQPEQSIPMLSAGMPSGAVFEIELPILAVSQKTEKRGRPDKSERDAAQKSEKEKNPRRS